MKLRSNSLTILCLIILNINLLSAQIQIGTDIEGGGNENTGYALSFSADADRIAIGAPVNYGNGLSSGHVRIFDLDGDDWVQIGATIEGETELDNAGRSVSLSADGNRLAIGSPGSSQTSGDPSQVQVYDWNGTSWTQIGNDIEAEDLGFYFGFSVSLSSDGNRMAIGAPRVEINGSSNAGQVKVYDLIGGEWVQAGTEINGNGEDAEMGTVVSLSADGNRLAVAAPYLMNFNNNGNLTIYDWNGSEWIQAGTTINGVNAAGLTSMSLSADGNTVAYSSEWYDLVKVFRWTGSNWYSIGQDIEGDNEFFGHSISLSENGSRIVIGATEANSNGFNSGTVQIYDLIENNWTQYGNDINGEVEGDRFGFSVALSLDGSRVAAATPDNDGGGQDGGHTRIFQISCAATSSVDAITACGSYDWIDGNTYTSSNNIATFTTTNTDGCDSIIQLDLSITSIDESVTIDGSTLNANLDGATYQWLDCDNNFAILTSETNQSFTATTNGSYAVIVTKNGCADTSECIMITSVNIKESKIEREVNLFPNPTDGVVHLDLGEEYKELRIIVRSVLGETIQVENYNMVDYVRLNIEEGNGIYFIELVANEGERGVFRVVKN